MITQQLLIAAGVPLGVGLLWAASRALAWSSGVWAREKPMRSKLPFPMRGKPDLIVWERDFSLTVADLKTRASGRVMRSDIIQLSCYAAMVRRKSWWKVNDHGYVIFPDGGKGRRERVRLLDEAELVRIRDRWDDILAGRVEPTKCDGRLCKTCAFRGEECSGAD